MKKLLFLALMSASITLFSCEGNGKGSERGMGKQTTINGTTSPSERAEASRNQDAGTDMPADTATMSQ